MATPSYKGSGQPQSGNGLFDGFSSWFGTTPTYAGDGQPSSTSSGYGGSGTPAYKSSSSGQSRAIDPSALPQGPFAIVIPRSFVPCDEPQQ